MFVGPVRHQPAPVAASDAAYHFSMRRSSLGPPCQQYLRRAAPGLGLACATASRPAQAPEVSLGRARRRRPPLQARQPVGRQPRQLSRRVLVCLPLSDTSNASEPMQAPKKTYREVHRNTNNKSAYRRMLFVLP